MKTDPNSNLQHHPLANSRFAMRDWSGVAFIMALMAAVLAMMGRSPWCQCGSLNPISWDVWSSHNSQHAIDPYFGTHMSHGLMFFAILVCFRNKVSSTVRFTIAVAMEAIWELFENTPWVINRYREATVSLDYFGDSIINSCFDMLACIIGYQIASRVPWQASLMLFVTLEVILLSTIRDSLIVNVIMLVCPIETLRDWQSAIAPK